MKPGYISSAFAYSYADRYAQDTELFITMTWF